MSERRNVAVLSLQKETPVLGRDSRAIETSNSNTSKVIRSVEDKGYIERNLGDCDKRQMYFSLTAEGKKILKEMECCNIEIPELLRSVL